MPTGQVSRWQTRIITQPETTRGAVAKPNSSAPEQRGHDHVPAGLDLAVDLDCDAVPETVAEKGLLGLGQSQLPGGPGMLQGGQRRGARAPVVAGDEHDVRVGLGHARGDGADADLGDELDVHAGRGLAFFRS